MFAREIQLSRLLGGHITPWALAVGTLDARPFYTMVRMQGFDLHLILQSLDARQQLLQPNHAIALIAHLVRATTQLHGGVMWDGSRVALAHRDLSPDNIFVTREGRIRLLDLGAALPVLPAVRHTKAFAVGKVRYMAPELRAEGVVDPRSDIYAIGRIMEDILQRSAPLQAGLARDMEDIIEKCTAERFFRRWRSTPELLRSLVGLAGIYGVSLDLASAFTCLKKSVDFESQALCRRTGTRLLTRP